MAGEGQDAGNAQGRRKATHIFGRVFLSRDAIQDESLGLVFPARIGLSSFAIRVGAETTPLTAGQETKLGRHCRNQNGPKAHHRISSVAARKARGGSGEGEVRRLFLACCLAAFACGCLGETHEFDTRAALSDEEITDAAIQHELALNRRLSISCRDYGSVAEFRAANPECCSLERGRSIYENRNDNEVIDPTVALSTLRYRCDSRDPRVGQIRVAKKNLSSSGQIIDYYAYADSAER